MAVDTPNVIDIASIDNEGNAVLIIADHLDWDIENEHLLILQEKINTYLGAIESGNIYEEYPVSKNKNFIIELVTKFPPNLDGMNFIEQVKMILNDAGYGFSFWCNADGN